MYNKAIFARNLKRLMDETDRNQNDIARVTGVSATAVGTWVRGEKTPRMDKVVLLARLFGCTVADLLEEGREAVRTRRVPRIGSIACGEPILAEQNLEGYDEVPDFVKCDFTLVARGNSMSNARILDGDIVCVKAQQTATDGQIVVASVEGAGDTYEATLKRIRFMADGTVLLCPDSTDPAYVPLLITRDKLDCLHIQGVATHFISTIK